MRKSLTPALGSCDSLNTARVFGVPLEELLQVGQPGQEVPILVKRIVEYIEEHGGLDLDGLFLVNGNAERVEWLRQRCESGEEVDLEKEADVASAVSLLRLFLQELPEPLIPVKFKEFDLSLPQFNYSLLRFLCRFLSNVASLQEEVWTAGGLAAVFGPDIFHIATDVEDLKEQELVSRVMADLIENKEEFFDSEEEDFSTNDYSSITEHVRMVFQNNFIVIEVHSIGAPSASKLRTRGPQSHQGGRPLVSWRRHKGHILYFATDPVPAFKSWQEDTESGEAQLSPLAGRIVHHPLEDDSHPLLARRFLEFGHSQRFLQDQDTNFPVKSPPLGRPRRASFSSKEEGRGDAVPVQVSKKVQSLKKKIKQFEEQFEKDHNYKPSHSDKAANPKVLKWMTELTKLRKQIKGNHSLKSYIFLGILCKDCIQKLHLFCHGAFALSVSTISH
uniref:Family with sequence similarity 13 member B n=1 Tax=Erpetoichthys calabaricus TaxID=27687 RepID=A0A8C4SGL0_ERPCA